MFILYIIKTLGLFYTLFRPCIHYLDLSVVLYTT